jgi:hypothetical protein
MSQEGGADEADIRDPQRTVVTSGGSLRCFDGLDRAFERPSSAGQKGVAWYSKGDIAVCSLKETGAHFLFQVNDLRAKGGMANAQGLSSFSEALMFCDGQKIAEVSEFHCGGWFDGWLGGKEGGGWLLVSLSIKYNGSL